MSEMYVLMGGDVQKKLDEEKNTKVSFGQDCNI